MTRKTYYIYEILDQNDNPVYVGKSHNVEGRIKKHIIDSKKAKSGIGVWIRQQPLPIKYRVIIECHKDDASKVEKKVIRDYIESGVNLINIQCVDKAKNPTIERVEYNTLKMSTNLCIEFEVDEYNEMEKYTPSGLEFLFNRSYLRHRLKSALIEAVKKELINISKEEFGQ